MKFYFHYIAYGPSCRRFLMLRDPKNSLIQHQSVIWASPDIFKHKVIRTLCHPPADMTTNGWRSYNGTKNSKVNFAKLWVISGSVSLPGLDLDFTASYSIFGPHIVFELVLIKPLCVIRKNMAARWHCCGSESLHSFFLKGRFDERESRAESSERVAGRREGGRRGEDAERENHGRIVVCFPNVNSRGSGTEQLNIQTAQWGSERGGAAVEHGRRQVYTEDRLLLIQEELTERTRCSSDTPPPTHPDSQHMLTHL